MKQRERDEFVSIMAQEGVPLHAIETLLRASKTLTRLAELECSSEAADLDRVPCPHKSRILERRQDKAPKEHCLCRDYGSFDEAQPVPEDRHGTVPRIMVKGARLEARVQALCEHLGLVPIFSGDPRGAVLKIKVPSGRTNDWGNTGICVP